MRQSERLRAKQLRKSLSELEEQKEISRENERLRSIRRRHSVSTQEKDYEVYNKMCFYNNLLRVFKCLLKQNLYPLAIRY